MTATLRNAEVSRFVGAVRQALDDLTPDEVDELTGGLEADLDDALADDAAAQVDRFGSPADYAAELRSAAGLPPRADHGGLRGAGPLTRRVDAAGRAWGRWLERLRAQRWWPPVRDFLVSVRPVWWAVRGWVSYQFLAGVLGRGGRQVLPGSPPGWFVLLVLVVVSVQLGRRVAAGPGSRRQRWLNRVVSVLAALLLLPILAWTREAVVIYQDSPIVPPSNGLWLNGTEVRNVFPYDAQGRPLTDVQLFDENGRSLAVGTSARTPLLPNPYREGDRAVGQVPAVDANNRPVWNAYPLRQQEVKPGAGPYDPGTGVTGDLPVSAPSPARRPLQTTLPIAPPAAGVASGSPTSSVSPLPSVSAAPSAVASPSRSASPPAGSTASTGSPTASPR